MRVRPRSRRTRPPNDGPLIIILLLLLANSGQVGADGWYTDLRTSNGVSCRADKRSSRDCRPLAPTELRRQGDSYEAQLGDSWVAVEETAILRDIATPDGLAHTCVGHSPRQGANGSGIPYVRCLILPSIGSERVK